MPAEQCRYLLGQGSIHTFMRFVKSRVVAGHSFVEGTLVEKWHATSDRLAFSSLNLAKASDGVPGELPRHLAETAAEFLRRPGVRDSFGYIPTRWGMIDLDRVILQQPYITETFCAALSSRIPASPSPLELLEISAGEADPPPNVNVVATSGNNFLLTSQSSDLQILATRPIPPESIPEPPSAGRIKAVIGIFVGYGPNFLWVIQRGNRLLLANGTHRAFALRSSGLTSVPAVVTRIMRDDDLDLLGITESKSELLSLYSRERPPLLGDLFDPDLFITLPTHPWQNVIQVGLRFEQTRVPLG